MELVPLDVARREKLGSADSRRTRAAGRIPAVLYGLGRANASLTVDTKLFETHFKKGRRMFELRMGELTQVSLLRAVGYDSLGKDFACLDFQRVDDTKPTEMTVSVEFVGTPAPTAGAMVEYINRDLLIRCLPRKAPEKIEVPIGGLMVGSHIEAGQVKLPDGVELADRATKTLVTYHYKAAEVAAPAAPEGTAEPVVLTEKKPKDATAPKADAKAAKPAPKK